MKTVADFDSLDSVDILAQEAAETDELSGGMENHRKLGRLSRVIACLHLFEKRSRFFSRLRTQRKAHEVCVGHQSREEIEIVVVKRPQN